MAKTAELRIPALEIKQSDKRLLYTFAVDGKLIASFATVSRISRNNSNEVIGYQRPEVLSHISEIRNYLESKDPMLPNAIVIAFDNRVRFEASSTRADSPEYVRLGTLVIPVDAMAPDANKPGWIVDGQQRSAAIREAEIGRFPVAVTAFITNNISEQREQFILVNSTKPLPKGLIYELLPSTMTTLPSMLQRRRFPTVLLNRLNYDEDSPLKGKINTPTVPGGLIKDNSILKMIENSMTDGLLYRFRDPKSGEGDVDAMLRTLKSYWEAVAEVFDDAWNLPPRKSRLIHGAGITSMGYVMDAIGDRYGMKGIPTVEEFQNDISPLKEVCRWTHGYWDFGPGVQRKWSEIQNTSKDIQILSNYLLVKYRELVWNRSGPGKSH